MRGWRSEWRSPFTAGVATSIRYAGSADDWRNAALKLCEKYQPAKKIQVLTDVDQFPPLAMKVHRNHAPAYVLVWQKEMPFREGVTIIWRTFGGGWLTEITVRGEPLTPQEYEHCVGSILSALIQQKATLKCPASKGVAH